MKNPIFIILSQMTLTLILSVGITIAQMNCDVDIRDVLRQVEDVCTQVGENQVCYGNYEVSALAQANTPDFKFSEQGDLVAIENIRSLYLSGLDPEENRWGIAQMRLLASTSNGTQDVNLLLFGDVEIENSIEQTPVFDALVGRYAVNIRNAPRANALVLASIPSGETLMAVARLDDNSWVRVKLDEGNVGWVSSDLISLANEVSLSDLPIQDSSQPYFGAMQAFYYSEGEGSQCGNVASDGLLIQTPQGTARVTLLINEVSIELIPNQNGATAYVRSSLNGMTVSMIDGTAEIESNGSSFFVDATQQTTIELDDNLRPIGTPSVPVNYEVQMMADLPLLGIVRDNTLPITSSTIVNDNNNDNSNVPSPNGEANNNNSSSNNGNGNNNANGNSNGRNNGNANGNANGGGNGNGNANGQSGN